MNHTIRTCGTRPCVDTGRGVVIGRAHIPQANSLHNPDMDAIQRALLSERRRVDWDGVAIIGGVALFLLVVGVAL